MSTESIENIMAVYDQVDEIDRREGLVAYRRYRDSLQRYADVYRLPLRNVVGAFCALSPNNDYVGNLRSLVTLLAGREHGQSADQCTVSTYKACRDRAWKFLDGVDFLQVTQGKKTRNFYMNILDPDDPQPVTVDGHMMCVYLGKRMTMKEVVGLRQRYEPVADSLREVAGDVGLIPNQLQAMLWFTWKRINDIRFTPQFGLFTLGNQWGTSVNLESIRPYSSRHSTRREGT